MGEKHILERREVLFFFISGVVVSAPLTLYAENLVNQLCMFFRIDGDPYLVFLCGVLAIPFIEEFTKAYPLLYRHGETQRSIFILGFAVGLGFGLTEFVLFVTQSGAPITSRLPAMIFHAASTSIIAYGIGRKRTVPFFGLAVVLHLLGNLSTFITGFRFIGGFISLFKAYSLALLLYMRTTETPVSTDDSSTA